MKKAIFLFFPFIIVSCACLDHGSSIDSKRKLEHIRVVDCNGSKNEVFVMVNQWFVETFNHAGSIIQFSDKEEGHITGKFISNGYLCGELYEFKSVITINIKDSKARIRLSNPYIRKANYSHILGFMPVTTRGALEELVPIWKNVADSFETYMLLSKSAEF